MFIKILKTGLNYAIAGKVLSVFQRDKDSAWVIAPDCYFVLGLGQSHTLEIGNIQVQLRLRGKKGDKLRIGLGTEPKIDIEAHPVASPRLIVPTGPSEIFLVGDHLRMSVIKHKSQDEILVQLYTAQARAQGQAYIVKVGEDQFVKIAELQIRLMALSDADSGKLTLVVWTTPKVEIISGR